MDLILTSIIAPIVIGVLQLLIEYWIIIPAREQTTSKNTSIKSTALVSSIAIVSLGAIVFTFAIGVMLAQIVSFNFFFVSNDIPYASSVSFAAIIFVCAALNYVTFYYNGSILSRFFTARILPPALGLLWGMSFLQGQGSFFFVLIAINIWVLAPLYTSGNRTPLQIIVLAAMLPVNALSFVLTVSPNAESLGWFVAGFILLCSLGFLGTRPVSDQSDNNPIENDNS